MTTDIQSGEKARKKLYQRLRKLVIDEECRKVDEILDLVFTDASGTANVCLVELLDELPYDDDDEWRCWSVTADVMLTWNGEKYESCHLLLRQSVEGSTPTEALADLRSVCYALTKFLFEKCKGDLKRWRELEPLLRMIVKKGGVEGWFEEFDREVKEWKEANPWSVSDPHVRPD